jgi:hypothetical protein
LYNYGYVYTADKDAINKAQADLDKATNDLYNTQLDATNKYGEKAIQAKEELYQKLTDINNTYTQDSEEWLAAREEAIAEYQQKYAMYIELYGIAQKDNSDVVREAWVTTYDEIIDDSEKWKEDVTTYTGEVQ